LFAAPLADGAHVLTKRHSALFAWNCCATEVVSCSVMNGTGTSRQFVPQAARPGSRAAFARDAKARDHSIAPNNLFHLTLASQPLASPRASDPGEHDPFISRQRGTTPAGLGSLANAIGVTNARGISSAMLAYRFAPSWPRRTSRVAREAVVPRLADLRGSRLWHAGGIPSPHLCSVGGD
jgi:hypothetical protein